MNSLALFRRGQEERMADMEPESTRPNPSSESGADQEDLRIIDLMNDASEDAQAVRDRALRAFKRSIDEYFAPASSMCAVMGLGAAGFCGLVWHGIGDPVLGVFAIIFSSSGALFVAMRWQMGRLNKAIQHNGDSSLVWRVFSKSLDKGLSTASPGG